MFIKPCHGPIMSVYDSKRKHPKTGAVQPHWGVDYGTAPNNEIVAAASGNVRFIARNHETAGNYIVITHANGWETAYLHLSSISVRVGQDISQGEKIGVKGATGKFVTGVHLHFEVAKGKWTGGSSLNVNPALYIDDPDVRTLQTNLNKLGYKLIVDGKYGDSTKDAVKVYQSKNGLIVDGVAGRLTMAEVIKSAGKVVASTQPIKKEDDDLEFTSGTLKKEWETFLNSKAQREIAVREAVKQGYNAKWIKDLEDGKIADGDVAALAIGALIRANK